MEVKSLSTLLLSMFDVCVCVCMEWEEEWGEMKAKCLSPLALFFRMGCGWWGWAERWKLNVCPFTLAFQYVCCMGTESRKNLLVCV